ncbi:MAG: hypothetical protein GXN98_01290 [Euryarchaeota archaeon]|nr:hypothetical protein [Euryarchaeota archaeon]
MDVEGFARRRLLRGEPEEEVVRAVARHVRALKSWGDDAAEAFARAVVRDAVHALSCERAGGMLGELLRYPRAEVGMGEFGVGSRGEGDFFVHRLLGRLAEGGALPARELDDAGAVRAGSGYLALAVDGMHSRLSEFPFLAGFHCTRAALRDICVVGFKPVATLADLHLADDGDVGKLFDFTAGVACAGELCSAPLVAGSTLRIGGDMVLGERLVGCAAAAGVSEEPPRLRKHARAGDVLLMSTGKGGGTVTTIAIYHGWHEVVMKTLNVEFMLACELLRGSELMEHVHAMTDVTNGGIRGDAHEIARASRTKLVLDEEAVYGAIEGEVLEMLQELGIDPLGISVDSLLLSVPEEHAEDVRRLLSRATEMHVVGRVERGSGVYIEGREVRRLEPRFREAAYTEVKRAVGEEAPEDVDVLRRRVESAWRQALEKKRMVMRYIKEVGA